MKPKYKKTGDRMQKQYNFDYTKAVRGKYYKRLLHEGSNVVMLEPDVAKAFKNSAEVNDALRLIIELSTTAKNLTKQSGSE